MAAGAWVRVAAAAVVVLLAVAFGGVREISVAQDSGGGSKDEPKKAPNKVTTELVGVLFDAKGEPVHNAKISPVKSMEWGWSRSGINKRTESRSTSVNGKSVTTDEKGHFAVRVTASCRPEFGKPRVALMLEKEGYPKQRTLGFEVTDTGPVRGDSEPEKLHLTLYKPTLVKGRVVTEGTENGVANAVVRVETQRETAAPAVAEGMVVDTDDMAIETTTDAQGNYTISNLLHGQLELVALPNANAQAEIGEEGAFGSGSRRIVTAAPESGENVVPLSLLPSVKLSVGTKPGADNAWAALLTNELADRYEGGDKGYILGMAYAMKPMGKGKFVCEAVPSNCAAVVLRFNVNLESWSGSDDFLPVFRRVKVEAGKDIDLGSLSLEYDDPPGAVLEGVVKMDGKSFFTGVGASQGGGWIQIFSDIFDEMDDESEDSGQATSQRRRKFDRSTKIDKDGKFRLAGLRDEMTLEFFTTEARADGMWPAVRKTVKMPAGGTTKQTFEFSSISISGNVPPPSGVKFGKGAARLHVLAGSDGMVINFDKPKKDDEVKPGATGSVPIDAQGRFTIPGMVPGTYRFAVDAPGVVFKMTEVEVGKNGKVTLPAPEKAATFELVINSLRGYEGKEDTFWDDAFRIRSVAESWDAEFPTDKEFEVLETLDKRGRLRSSYRIERKVGAKLVFDRAKPGSYLFEVEDDATSPKYFTVDVKAGSTTTVKKLDFVYSPSIIVLVKSKSGKDIGWIEASAVNAAGTNRTASWTSWSSEGVSKTINRVSNGKWKVTVVVKLETVPGVETELPPITKDVEVKNGEDAKLEVLID